MQSRLPAVTEPILTNIELLVKEYRTNLLRFTNEHPELPTDIEQLAKSYRAELLQNAARTQICTS